MLKYDPLRAPDPDAWLESDEAERLAAIEDYHRRLGVRMPSVPAHAVLHSIVENQLALGKPATVRPALERLVSEGLDRHEAIHAISVLTRIFRGWKEKGPADELNADYERELAAITPESWRAEFEARLEFSEILDDLETNRGYFPEQAVYQALERRDEFAGPMLRVLEDVAANPSAYADSERMIQIYAAVLLAEWRDARAYPLLVRVFSLPGDVPDRIFGDFITEMLPYVLASVCDGDLAGIRSLIEDESVDSFVRWAAIDSLLCLVANRERTRDEIMAYYASLFQRLPREPGGAWDGLVNACADLWPGEVEDEIRGALDDDLPDCSMFGPADLKSALRVGKPAALATLTEERAIAPRSLIEDLSDWACFSDDEEFEPDEEEEDEEAMLGTPPPPETLRRTAPKVGRNDPCPCGSGKKFKKCCGA